MAVPVTPSDQLVPIDPLARPAVSPVRVMARMKVAMLRHTLRDPRTAGWIYVGTALGLILAAGTIWAAFLDADLVAVGMAIWLLGWIIGPLLSSSNDPLHPEYFSGLGLSPRRLALSLVGGSLAGFGPLVSLIAAISLIVVGVRLGPAAAVASIPVTAAQLLLFVSISKLAVALYGLLLRARIGAAISGVVIGFMLAFTAQGWALVAAFVSNDVAAALGVGARAMPSGWGLVAIEAAARGDWAITVLVFLAMIILSVAAVAGWSALLHRRTTSTIFRIRPHRLLHGANARQASLGKELRSLTRDLLYSNRLVFSASYGLFFCLMPVAIGWKGLLPWAAPLFVLMAASMSANLYGNDGTSLWMIISTPRAAMLDVRVRQVVFLIMVGPLAVIMAVITTAFADSPGQWAYVAATLPALLGGGAGLSVLLSVFLATPRPAGRSI